MTRILRLLLIAAIALPLWQHAAAIELKKTETVYQYTSTTICDGTTSNESAPIYGYYFDTNNTESQMIYRKSRLGTDLKAGDIITAITFYTYTTSTTTVPTNIGDATVQVRFGETDATAYTSSSTKADMDAYRNSMTTVFRGKLSTGRSTMTIRFDEPYEYKGGNLIIDTYVEAKGSYEHCYWTGVPSTRASAYYQNYNNGNTFSTINFLPKMKIDYGTPVQQDIQPRDIVVKGKDFYEGKTYTWKENGTGKEHTSKLDTIANDPDEIIALLKRVYTDPTFPGNKKRGFTSTGGEDHDDEVPYTAVGKLKADDDGYIVYDDTYGWGITTNPKGEETDPNIYSDLYSNYYYYWYMNPKQYEPEEEGLTMLLLELQDNFTPTEVKDEDGTTILPAVTIEETGGYAQLREYFAKTIKSARILTEAMRTGDGLQAGTLFKIDCDKMNKFYLIAKGQLQWIRSTWFENQTTTFQNFYSEPCYVYYYYSDNDYKDYGYIDSRYKTIPFFLGHMFEQFSPSMSATTGETETGARTDIYRDLTEMKSFGVVHDCPNVPWVSEGHHFMMYGPDSKSEDCTDVRDMMFFVPDYRMLDHNQRGSYSGSDFAFQDYFRYHPNIQPKMGLYVIRQDPIVETTAYTDDYYHLTLTWKTNLDEFMPGEQQEFDLLEVVYNEKLGRNEYIPVYYTRIADDGKTVVYCDENGNEVNEENKVPVKLKFDQAENKVYTNVFVQRENSSREVTYAIQGRDAEDPVTKKHFLSLQMSNQESYVIKGTDPSEIVSLIELSHYSRFNVQKKTNCYSNRFKLMNNIDGMKAANITPSTTKLVFKRKDTSSNEMVQIATATFNAGNKLTVVMQNQAPETDFPFGLKSGEKTGLYAGYHKNPTNASGVETWELSYDVVDGYISFNDETPLVIIDNFTADVSKGTHPGRYMYEAFTEGINHVDGDAFTGEGHSNMFNVVIYKTNSGINALTKTQVDEDVDGSYPIDDAIKFDVDMQLSSKSEILRYDAYRWTVGQENWGFIVDEVYGEDDEQDCAPTGQADNEGEYYTIRMNSDVTGLETNGTVSVTDGSGTGTFVDKYPYTNTTSAEAYTYAPVVESFGRDKFGDERGDYNTYGGPLQEAGNALLDIKYVVPEIVPGKPAVMTDYAWWDNDGKKCAYYTLNLQLKTKEVPANYEIYKVRAWHQVLDMNDNPAPQYLREQFDELNDRKGDDNGKYMFDEFTYPVCQADPSKWSPNDLGSESDRSIVDQSGNTVNFTKGTFGALKVRTNEPASDNSVIDGFKIKYFVRIYFAPENVVKAIPQPTQPAPAIQPKDEETGEATTQEAKTFYVVEATDVYVVDKNIVTAIDNLNASEVVGVKYYNVAGIESDRPFQGVNIVVTRYSDGSTTTTKVLK